ncbi:hypothetical protein A3Q56_06899 [Intoshia linei]|uniref:Uncharacterized protein n=1 Tax=Intoshia linei TaxID=1819745 RepID=A0A177AW08_9BILA|nr:hypothetical protein A3Q56_06899 [Intoshia linei]
MSGSNSIDKNIKSKFEEVYNYIETNDRDHDNITKLSDYSDTSESLQYINAVFQDSFSFNKNVCLFEDRLVQTYLKIYYENNTINYQTNKNLKTILNKTQIAEMIYIAKNELLNSWKLLLSNISFQILRNYEQEKLKKILFFKHLTIAENSFKKLLNIKDCYSNVSKSNIFTDNANFVRLKSLLLLTLDKKFSKLKLKKLDILKLLNINLLVYQKKKKQKERVNTPASEIYKMYENTCYPSDEEFFDEFVKKSSVLSSSCFNVFKDSTISDSETKLESINLSRESSIW